MGSLSACDMTLETRVDMDNVYIEKNGFFLYDFKYAIYTSNRLIYSSYVYIKREGKQGLPSDDLIPKSRCSFLLLFPREMVQSDAQRITIEALFVLFHFHVNVGD